MSGTKKMSHLRWGGVIELHGCEELDTVGVAGVRVGEGVAAEGERQKPSPGSCWCLVCEVGRLER